MVAALSPLMKPSPKKAAVAVVVADAVDSVVVAVAVEAAAATVVVAAAVVVAAVATAVVAAVAAAGSKLCRRSEGRTPRPSLFFCAPSKSNHVYASLCLSRLFA